MARPRSRKKAAASGDYFAWSDLYYGGEVQEMKVGARGDQTRTVVVNRNIVRHGEPVDQATLGCDDDEWAHLIETGSVRPYAVPEGTDDRTSATRAFLVAVTDDEGNIDINKVMAMGASLNSMQPMPEATNPPAEEGKELETGTPEGA